MLHRVANVYRLALDKWLYRLPQSDPGEAFLHQRRVFIVPTKAGLGFGAMLVLLFIGSINYNLSLGFALTFLIGGCAVIDMHLTFRNLAYLSLAPGRVNAVFAGEDAHFELHLINRRKHDRYAIWLGFIGDDIAELEQAADVAAHSTCSLTLSMGTLERGWLAAPQVRLQTRFPLGLVRAWSYWRPDARALVYPQPEDGAPPLPITDAADAASQGRAGDDDFAGVRAYQAGDSMKRLAWRQIARLDSDAGVLVSKHFEAGGGGDLLLDFTSMGRALALETRLSRMTRWVLEAEARGLPYGFRLEREVFAASLGPAHRDACLRALALYGDAT